MDKQCKRNQEGSTIRQEYVFQLYYTKMKTTKHLLSLLQCEHIIRILQIMMWICSLESKNPDLMFRWLTKHCFLKFSDKTANIFVLICKSVICKWTLLVVWDFCISQIVWNIISWTIFLYGNSLFTKYILHILNGLFIRCKKQTQKKLTTGRFWEYKL